MDRDHHANGGFVPDGRLGMYCLCCHECGQSGLHPRVQRVTPIRTFKGCKFTLRVCTQTQGLEECKRNILK